MYTTANLVDFAKVAEQAERYEDMARFMTDVVKQKEDPLTDEERNLLSVAFKNVVGARRSAWRIVSSIEHKTADDKKEDIVSYKEKIEEELKEKCNEVLKLLADTLIPVAKTVEGRTFYYKMKGDYHRYVTEVIGSSGRDECVQLADESYKTASAIAVELPSTHPIKLGLALNYSVFFYEIMNDPKEACQLAKKSFDEAILELDNLKEDSYKDSTLIMQLLRDNLTLWTSETEPDNQDDM